MLWLPVRFSLFAGFFLVASHVWFGYVSDLVWLQDRFGLALIQLFDIAVQVWVGCKSVRFGASPALWYYGSGLVWLQVRFGLAVLQLFWVRRKLALVLPSAVQYSKSGLVCDYLHWWFIVEWVGVPSLEDDHIWSRHQIKHKDHLWCFFLLWLTGLCWWVFTRVHWLHTYLDTISDTPVTQRWKQ